MPSRNRAVLLCVWTSLLTTACAPLAAPPVRVDATQKFSVPTVVPPTQTPQPVRTATPEGFRIATFRPCESIPDQDVRALMGASNPTQSENFVYAEPEAIFANGVRCDYSNSISQTLSVGVGDVQVAFKLAARLVNPAFGLSSGEQDLYYKLVIRNDAEGLVAAMPNLMRDILGTKSISLPNVADEAVWVWRKRANTDEGWLLAMQNGYVVSVIAQMEKGRDEQATLQTAQKIALAVIRALP